MSRDPWAPSFGQLVLLTFAACFFLIACFIPEPLAAPLALEITP